MNRIDRLRWWLRSTWGATLAGFGIHRSTRVEFRWKGPGPEPDWSKFRQPPWSMPDDEIGVSAGTRAVLVSDERRAVVLADCVGYSNGFAFSISYRTRDKMPGHRPGPFDEMSVSVVYPNAVRAGSGEEAMTAHYEAFYAGADTPLPKGPIVGRHSASASDHRYDCELWCWPLPPDGPMIVTVEWKEAGLPATSVEVDASAIRRAGLKSKKLWT